MRALTQHSTGDLPAPAQAGASIAQRAEREWIPANDVAELLAVNESTIRRRCYAGEWESRYATAQGGGRRLEVALGSLAAELQEQYRAVHPAPAVLPAGEEREGWRDPETGLTAAESWAWAREVDRAAAAARLAVLTSWRQFAALHVELGRTEMTLQFLDTRRSAHPEANGLTRSTVYRWDRAYRDCGIVGLLPGYATGERGQDVPGEFSDLVSRYYLDRNGRKLTVCYEIAKHEIARLHPELLDKIPSLATVRRHIPRRWTPTQIGAARLGEDWLRRNLPSIETDFASYRVNQLWVSDHAQLDLVCIGFDGKPMRPWVTDFRDFCSRKRLGWLVHEGPSASTVLAAFAAAVERHGVPEGVKFDNGREYSGRTFAGGSRRWKVQLDEPRVLGLLEHLRLEDGGQVAVQFSQPKNPMGKASQERGYGVDREWMDKQWQSYCGKDPAARPEHLRYLRKHPEHFAQLAEVQYIYGLYAQWRNGQPHSGQGMDGQSPDAVFAAADIAARPVDPAELRLLMMKTSKPLTVQADGIWIFDRWYWSETLARLYGQKVYGRYALDRIGEVDVYTLEDRYIDTVVRTDLLRADATEQDYTRARAKKTAARRLALEFRTLQQQIATRPDVLLATAEDRKAGEAQRAQGAQASTAAPARKTGTVIHTPFAFAARRKAERAKEQRAAAARTEQYGDPLERLAAMQMPVPVASDEVQAERALEKLARYHQVGQVTAGR